MRLSYIFKQGIYRLILLVIIDAIFFYLALSGTGTTWAKFLPYPTIWLYVALILLFGITLRELKAFTKGAEGEQKVRRILKNLPPNYSTLSDFVNGQKGNIDFVVVGPTGVFTIEAKNYRGGNITFQNGVLYRNDYPFKKDVLKQTYAESKYLSEYLYKSLGLSFPVTPILVFTNPYTKLRFGLHPVNGVYVIGTSWLIKLIQQRQPTLNPDHCTKIKNEIKKYTSII